jgi:hypothetical protein
VETRCTTVCPRRVIYKYTFLCAEINSPRMYLRTSLASPHAEAWGCAKRLNVASASTVDNCEVEHRVGSHEITVHDNPVGARPVDGMFNYHFFLERENPPPY